MLKAKAEKLDPPETLSELIEFSLRQERAALATLSAGSTQHAHGWSQGFAEGAKRVREQLEALRANGSEIAL